MNEKIVNMMMTNHNGTPERNISDPETTLWFAMVEVRNSLDHFEEAIHTLLSATEKRTQEQDFSHSLMTLNQMFSRSMKQNLGNTKRLHNKKMSQFYTYHILDKKTRP